MALSPRLLDTIDGPVRPAFGADLASLIFAHASRNPDIDLLLSEQQACMRLRFAVLRYSVPCRGRAGFRDETRFLPQCVDIPKGGGIRMIEKRRTISKRAFKGM